MTVSAAFAIVAVIAAYALGTFPSAQLAGRSQGVDPTAAGSRNPGTTNVLRTAGREAAALTLVGDVGKGVVAAGLGWLIGGHGLGVACGLAAVIGHVAPLNRGLRGGKGVATAAGVLLALNIWLGLASLATFGIIVAFFRMISLASVISAVFAVCYAFFLFGAQPIVPAVGALALLLIWRHRENVGRILKGVEPRLGEKKA